MKRRLSSSCGGSRRDALKPGLLLAMLMLGQSPVTPAHAQDVITLGPEVPASVNDDGGLLRVEPAVVMVDSVIVVAWNDSWAGREHGVRTGVAIGWSYSVDSGRTFRFGGYVPNPRTESITWPSAADSWLVHDDNGTVYLQILHWPDQGDRQVRVYALSTATPDSLQFRSIAVAGPRLDKPAMTAGPRGELWVAYSDDNRIHVVQSKDHGRTWSEPKLVSNATSGVTRSGADVAVCGRRVAVAWIEDGSARDVPGAWMATGRASGDLLAPPQLLHRIDSALPVPPGYSLGLGQMARIPNNAWLACDPVASSGKLFLTFSIPVLTADTAGSRAVLMRADLEAGATVWDGPDEISATPSRYQAFPAVETALPGLAVAYYDWRHAEEGAGTDVYLHIQTREQVRDVRVTTVSTRWPELPADPEHAVVQRNVGDYLSLAGDGHRWAVAWTDGRSGRSRIMVRVVEIH